MTRPTRRDIELRLGRLESTSDPDAALGEEFTSAERERLERAIEDPSFVRDSGVLIRRACRLGAGEGGLALALERAIENRGPMVWIAHTGRATKWHATMPRPDPR